MGDRDAVHEVLFRHSDSRPCRLLWTALEAGREAPADLDRRDYLEAVRVTDGELCLAATGDQAETFVGWHRSTGRYLHVTFWPPWGVVDAGTADRASVGEVLEERAELQPVHYRETPFADEGTAADLSGWL
ncbi:MAG: hypothetical protein ABEJ31_15210 [Haloarculaceae archaeon]